MRAPAIVLLVMQMVCGNSHDVPSTDARCTLRMSARGIFVDGNPMSRADAVAYCKRRAAAMVVLEDGATQDEWKRVESDLQRERVTILMRGTVGDKECIDNPLARGCQSSPPKRSAQRVTPSE